MSRAHPPKPAPQTEALHQRHPGVLKHRLEALSDGVYAIVLTILVLELKVPALGHGATDTALIHALQEMVPRLITWLLSFFVVAIFWFAHQRMYRLCAAVNYPLAWLELIQLALVGLLPFSSALMGEYGGSMPAAVVYGGHLFAVALASWLRSAYFLRHAELQSADFTKEAAHALRLRAWLLTGCTLATFLLGFVAPGLNMLAMLPTALLSRVARL
jgi:uncharacterized membrane protein